MKQLDFTLSLIDKLTRPLKQVQSSVTGFAEKSKAAFTQIGGGALALAGTGMAIKGALSPAIEMYDALNDAAAKGIDDQALKAVQRDALRFSMTYGASAVEFVQSTESINTAIAGLTGNELPKVTKVANTLAFALKSTSADTAEFMGQMYGNFSAEAARLGKVQFAEQLAGKMVYMRKVFGTEMGVIKDLMEGARGVGTNYGVGLDEQLAVLGQLNRTLGTEASSAYEGFMTGAIEGGKKLGLSFTDATGKMLSMPEMLIKLQGKYGKSLEGNLKAQAELDAAFGDSSAVVKHLYGNVALLQRNITELGGSDGLKRTQEMAGKLVKPWDRFVQILKSIQTVIGLTLIPVLYPVLNRLADMGQTFARWMQLFPNIARVIGYAAMALLGFAAAGAVANIVLGVSTLIKLGAIALWKTLTSVTKIYTATVWIASKAVAAWNITLKFLRGTLLAVRMAAIMAGIGINLMSWPVLLVIGAIALLAAGCYLLIKHWDDVKAAVMNTAAFTAVAGVVEWLAGVFSAAWQWIKDGWNSFIALLSGFSPSQALSGMASGIVSLFDNVWQTIKSGFLKSWNWIVEKLNKIPGVNIDLSTTVSPEINKITGGVAPSLIQNNHTANTSETLTANTLSTGGKLKDVDRGGISKTISSNSKSVTDNSRKIGEVHFHTKEALSPSQLMEWQELNA
ncbi:phage tail tape measure protein [Salmonella enterica subsp. enterica]|uniref:phage tail tape measure protein n=1 Tax=Citrobacter freundii TaxID=546 RepID=UPI00127680EA|nr:phage tail tape measure protein [Citrobacter freundii]EBX3566915.1 phage tail tape measure protein [Salmonella enterica subsp. enterica serovar Java]ECE7307572.1 phage tail tape measure protein [Salmonella enterica subsp. enterica]ECI6391313.1 phage tail tape measure protein [Salmonella enterica subsp. enterica]EDI9351154.1 phage tail tape measure protein [Salmonella enterica subsp. enterica]EDQ4434288.1 phage tail tape measure protein [Salmonella enterica subsp. enterica]